MKFSTGDNGVWTSTTYILWITGKNYIRIYIEMVILDLHPATVDFPSQ